MKKPWFGVAAVIVLLMLMGCEDTATPIAIDDPTKSSAYVGTYALRSSNAEATLAVTDTSFAFVAAVKITGFQIASSGDQEELIGVEGTTNIDEDKVSLGVRKAHRNKSAVAPDELVRLQQCNISARSGESFAKDAGSALLDCIGADDNAAVLSDMGGSLDGTWIPRNPSAANLVVEGNVITFSQPHGFAKAEATIHPTHFIMKITETNFIPAENVPSVNSELADTPIWYIVRGSMLRINVLLGDAQYILHYDRAS